jgi:hypothetical protein
MSATPMTPVVPPTEPPKPVRRATTLMFLLAALYLVGLLLGALGVVVGGLSLLRRGDDQGKGLTAVGIGLAVIVLAVLLVGLWLAVKVRRGHRWARLFTTVLLMVGLAATILDSWHLLTANPVVVPVVGIVKVALMLAVLLLLWMPASARAYFAARHS